jgi:hypothetical protein
VTRPLRPRAPTAIAPATVSQLSCLPVLGVDERRFLEIVVPKCEHVSRLGRLRVVEVDDALRALRDLAPAEDPGEDPNEVRGDESEESGDFASVDAVLKKLGRVRKAGGQ